MARELLAVGTYPAKVYRPESSETNSGLVIKETKEGALTVQIPVIIEFEDGSDWKGKGTVTLVKRDGTPMTRAIESLVAIFGWQDVNNFFELEDLDASGAEFEVVIIHDDWIPDGETQPIKVAKVQWINEIGASAKMPQPVADRKKLLTKYGSKFKAVATARPAAKPAAAKAKPAPEPEAAVEAKPEEVKPTPAKKGGAPARPAPKSAGPPSRKSTSATARTCTQEEVWDLLCEANPDDDDKALGAKYYAAQDKLFPGANGDLTLQQWGEVANELGV